MEFEISKNKLLSILNVAQKYTSSKLSTTQILQGVYFINHKNKLKIITTNLNEIFEATINCKTIKKGEFIINIKTFLSFLNLINTQTVLIKQQNNQIVITQGKTIVVFDTYPTTDFPKINTGSTNNQTEISPEQQQNINKVLFSVSHEQGRPQLTGVHFTNKNGKNYIVTTDGFRLSINHTKKPIIDKATTISSFVTGEILRSNPKKLSISIIEKEKLIKINADDYIIYTRLIDGEFPPFEKVIPDGFKTKIAINKEDLINNVKLSAVFLKEKTNTLVFELEKDGLFIRPKNEDKQNSTIFQETLFFEGEPIKIAFNYKFVLDFLLNSTAEKIIIETNTTTSPCVFKEDKNDSFIHIIMPLRVDELEQ